MKTWYILGPAVVLSGLVWLVRSDRSEQTERVPEVVHTQRAHAWSAPSHQPAARREARPQRQDLLPRVSELVLHHSKFDGCYKHRVQSGQPIHQEDDQHAQEKISRDTR
jgi:hypothetical protein